ncbi:F0F1 ATP synthase subunit B [Tissierella pigra]|uniref:ATP synthase subunit b n=1 Tax=Tissierella pigra TaxID=2607614 RepID=A0A6N7XRX8_9FIRM|nr:F0F1 ATP synthase subunit B [Tissierella pigra]MBU5427837.1 F0F1 ATP synthase subunit B [Tissierella pigra]MSU00163.1 F0F1 ATP synthase subunit B [Tissierella pigra]
MNVVIRPLPILSSMIISWVALLLLYLILRKFLYKPVSTFLQNRKDKIQTDIQEAEGLKNEAVLLKNEYESRISLAKKESNEIIEGARKRGEELKEDIIEEARREAENIVSRARKEITREREMAFQNIKSQAGEIALLIASKIMEEEINNDKQGKLIDKFIDEVGNQEWQS